MSLIAELKEDHRKIKALIEEIKSRSIASEGAVSGVESAGTE